MLLTERFDVNFTLLLLQYFLVSQLRQELDLGPGQFVVARTIVDKFTEGAAAHGILLSATHVRLPKGFVVRHVVPSIAFLSCISLEIPDVYAPVNSWKVIPLPRGNLHVRCLMEAPGTEVDTRTQACHTV